MSDEVKPYNVPLTNQKAEADAAIPAQTGSTISAVNNASVDTSLGKPASPAQPYYAGNTDNKAPPANAPPTKVLNVDDALSYLDLVKTQFADQPAVYNQFLDIMKEFKAQIIDTPGVIRRVCTLFRGHSALIHGFNTFLPPGHKIELEKAAALSKEENAGINSILNNHPVQQQYVSPPSGTAFPINNAYVPNPGYVPNANTTGYIPAPSNAYSQPANAPAFHPQSTGAAYYPPPSSTNSYIPSSPAYPPQAAVGTMPIHNPQMQRGVYNGPINNQIPTNVVPPKRGPLEFNHAINYVNKIKNRFANEPEVYKSFLEILHTYQKEQRTIREVFQQVSMLFKQHSDLLEEFSQFLPENPVNVRAIPANPQPPVGPFQPARQTLLNASRKAPSPALTSSSNKRNIAPPATAQPIKRMKTNPKVEKIKSEFEEFEFFEKVKRFLNNKQVYSEFLKCINLYTQEVINVNDLVKLVQGFLIKAPELMEWFKSFVGYKEPLTDEIIIKEVTQLDLSRCKKMGSYRAYPRNYQRPVCSGWDDLSKEVLNDTLVSCPQFNSEDNAFLSSKKNQYEEILFKCEDERFEMDLLIEANLATIQVLEPLQKRLLTMPEDEAKKLKLSNNFGGTSDVVYVKAITKLYADKASEVIESLKSNPIIAVPLILRRLKQKDDEWRRCQREWNKIWREVHFKNHYKSLDHQGINFKQNDRKQMTLKSLTTEIETLKLEQSQNKIAFPKAQYEFAYQDMRIFNDLLNLTLYYIGKSNFPLSDKKLMVRFLTGFVKRFYGDNDNDSKGSEADDRDDSSSKKSTDSKTSYVMYANNAFYAFFRLFQMGYSRLEQMKSTADDYEQNPPMHQHISPIAGFLDVYKPQLYDTPPSQYYSTMVDLIKKLLDGSLDQNSFEDHLRVMYGIGSFIMFTFDKLILSIARQIQFIINDPKNEQLISLYERERDSDKTSFRSEYSFRFAADSLIGDERENLYCVNFDLTTRKLSIELIDKAYMSQDLHSVEEKWSIYVDKFVHKDQDLLLNQSSQPLFLQRCLKNKEMLNPHFLLQYNLECKICVNTYKMFFVENSEDFMYRQSTINEEISKKLSRQKSAKFASWIKSRQ